MRSVLTTETRALIRAAVREPSAVLDTADGCRPVRLPDWALAQVDDPILRLIGNTTSGVRLSVSTAATWLELTASTERTTVPGIDPEQYPAVFAATIGKRFVERPEVQRWLAMSEQDGAR